MTTQEMHIEIDLELQKINSQIFKNIIPQEKDWFLNNETMKFIKQRASSTSNTKGKGFENDVKRLEDVKDWIRISDPIPVRTNSLGESFISLPPDYFSYVRADAFLAKDCNQTLQLNPITRYKTVIELQLPNTLPTTYTIDSINESLITSSLFNINNLPNGYLSNQDFNKQKFLLLNALRIQLPNIVKSVISPTALLYREREGETYTPYSFTLITESPITIVVTVDSNSYTYTSTAETFNTYNISDLPLKATMRNLNHEFTLDATNSSISGSRIDSPICEQRQGILTALQPSGAILGYIQVIYICIPTIIDLLLDSQLDAQDKVAKEIVGNTVRFIKAVIQSDNYNEYTRENLLIE